MPVFELNSAAPDGRSTIRSDGLEIDLSTRAETLTVRPISIHHTGIIGGSPGRSPRSCPDAVNSGPFNARPALSNGGRTLYFTFLTAEGHLDLLVSTRTAIREHPERIETAARFHVTLAAIARISAAAERNDSWEPGEPHSFPTTWRAIFAITTARRSKMASRMPRPCARRSRNSGRISKSQTASG